MKNKLVFSKLQQVSILDVPHYVVDAEAIQRRGYLDNLLRVAFVLEKILCRDLHKQRSHSWHIILHNAVVCIETNHIVVFS